MVEKNYLSQLFNLTNQVAIVTGGLGILGTEYSMALAKAGAKVAIYDLKVPDSSHVLFEFSKKYPVKFYKVDITKRDEVEKTFSSVIEDLGTCEILVNNAAIDFPPKPNKVMFEDYPIDEWEEVLKTNLTGTLICCQVIGREMARAGRG